MSEQSTHYKPYVTERYSDGFEDVSAEVRALGAQATRLLIERGDSLEAARWNTRPEYYKPASLVEASEWSLREQGDFVENARNMYGLLGASSEMTGSTYDFTLIAQNLGQISSGLRKHIQPAHAIHLNGRALKDHNSAVRTYFRAEALHSEFLEEIALRAVDQAMTSQADSEVIHDALADIAAAKKALTRSARQIAENHDWEAFDAQARERLTATGVEHKMRIFDMDFAALLLRAKDLSPSDYTKEYKRLLTLQLEELSAVIGSGQTNGGNMFEYVALCMERIRLIRFNVHSRALTRLSTAREDAPKDGHIKNGELSHAHDIVTTSYDGDLVHSYRYQIKGMPEEKWHEIVADDDSNASHYHPAVSMVYLPGHTNLSSATLGRAVGNLRLATNSVRASTMNRYPAPGKANQQTSLMRQITDIMR